MIFTGICPRTNKEEAIYCDTINAGILNGKINYIPGLMYACSAINGRKNLCNDCPINPANKSKE